MTELIYDKHKNHSVEAEKIKKVVVHPMTLVMLDDNDRETHFYIVKGCYDIDCTDGIGLGDFDTKDEAMAFAKNIENINKKERV